MVRMKYQDDRSTEQIITRVCDALDSMTERVERKITLLDTAKHLVGDYCMAHMNSKMETPRELKLVIELLDLIMSDSRIENDMLSDYNMDLGKVIDSIHNKTPW